MLDYDFIRRAIPVHTGQIRWNSLYKIHSKAHPRACGADGEYCQSNIDVLDSSPCVQSRFSHNCTPCSFHWFIPVHTGQIFVSFLNKFYTRVHPRVYGADTKLPKNLCYYKIANPISNSYGRISMYHLFRMCFCG